MIFTAVIISTAPRVLATCDFTTQKDTLNRLDVGGSTIYTYYSSHITGEGDRINEIMGEDISQEEMIAKIQAFLDEPQAAQRISEDRAQVQRIVNAARGGGIQWIGIEASPEEMGNDPNLSQKIAEYNSVRNAFSYIIDDPNQLEEMLHMYFDPQTIARASHPEVFANIPVVPLDNKEQKDRAFGYLEQLDNGLSQLYALENSGQLSREEAQGFFDYQWSSLEGGERLSDEAISSYAGRFENPDVQRIIRRNLETVNSIFDSSAARSLLAAGRAIDQTGNGLILFGSGHGEQIDGELRRHCLSLSGGSAPVGGGGVQD